MQIPGGGGAARSTQKQNHDHQAFCTCFSARTNQIQVARELRVLHKQRRPGLLNLSTQRFLHHHALSSARLIPAPPGECSLGLHDQLAPEPTGTQRGTIDPSYQRGARLYIETEKAGCNGDIPVEKPTPQPEVPYFLPLQVGSFSVTYSPVL